MFETNFSEQNKIWEAQRRFGGNCPKCPTVFAGVGRTVARKSFIGSLQVCVWGLSILKINYNSQHEQHLQIVQINCTCFPANTHNRLIVSN